MENKVNFMPKHTILLVDDEAPIRDMLAIALEAADYNVLQAEMPNKRMPVLLIGIQIWCC